MGTIRDLGAARAELDEGMVIDLRGAEYVAACERRQVWDETVLVPEED